MRNLFFIFYFFLFFLNGFSQVENNLKIDIGNNPIALYLNSVFGVDTIIIKSDTSIFVNTSSYNFCYLQDDKKNHYLFLTNDSLVSVSYLDGFFETNGAFSSFITFLNEYYSIYKPKINDLIYKGYKSDEFEIYLYNIINNEVFDFYSNYNSHNQFSTLCQDYFMSLLKYEYLHSISKYLMKREQVVIDLLPSYLEVNYNLLNKDLYFKNLNDSANYSVDIFLQYIFNTTVLFTIDETQYFSDNSNSFLNFTNDFFSFVKRNIPDKLWVSFLTQYIDVFSINFNNKIIHILTNFLYESPIDKEHLDSILKSLDNLLHLDRHSIDNDVQTNIYDFYLEDIKGNSVSLNQFDGKILYIDIWASWCGPCKKQFPYANDLKSKFSKRQLKKIKFIYISIDNDYDRWKSSVKKIDVDGYHFISPANQYNSVSDYFNVSGIPRYIIIGKDGQIVQNNAKRPSDSTLFNDLLQLLQ